VLDAELTQPMRLPTGTVSRAALTGKPNPVRARQADVDEVTAVIEMPSAPPKEHGADAATSDGR
jgi:hypothetical protein